jgi:hypothetical protein
MLLLALVLFVQALGAPVVPFRYPLYMQCDARWGQHALGTSRDTICSDGCAMSSVAMFLEGRNETERIGTVTPLSLNEWLVKHGGYVEGDLIVWNSVAPLGKLHLVAYSNSSGLSAGVLRSHIKATHPVVANVRGGSHWILVTGYDTADPTLFYVNDPFYPSTTYRYSDMLRFAVYAQTGAAPAGLSVQPPL